MNYQKRPIHEPRSLRYCEPKIQFALVNEPNALENYLPGIAVHEYPMKEKCRHEPVLPQQVENPQVQERKFRLTDFPEESGGLDC
jgi:hypothetical protein